ncbi:MAG: serine hydrolase domain-containing protein [Candidatus Ranarchaeia archaeon]
MVPNQTSLVGGSEPDYWPTNGWRTSTPEEQGMSAERFEDMEAFIQNQTWRIGIHSILVVQNGYIVYEDYPHFRLDINDTHNIYSCTKSVMSALYGIAIELGYFGELNATVLSFFPNRTIANLDARKQAMTLEHLLTMTTGFEWDEWTNTSWTAVTQSGDWVQHILDLPMRSDPGTEWVSAILQETTGNTTEEFAEEHLFDPLNITEYSWGRDPQDINVGGSDLEITPRSMAKFGYLYLHNGTWDGVQVVPRDWVNKSTSALYEAIPGNEYGYQWWVRSNYRLFLALGYLCQLIYVSPTTNTVIVFTGGVDLEASFFHLVETFIIPEITPPAQVDYTPLVLGAVGVTGAVIVIIAVYYYKKPRLPL